MAWWWLLDSRGWFAMADTIRADSDVRISRRLLVAQQQLQAGERQARREAALAAGQDPEIDTLLAAGQAAAAARLALERAEAAHAADDTPLETIYQAYIQRLLQPEHHAANLE